jgi:hypothetical protein
VLQWLVSNEQTPRCLLYRFLIHLDRPTPVCTNSNILSILNEEVWHFQFRISNICVSTG